jgi:hypothetical protein
MKEITDQFINQIFNLGSEQDFEIFALKTFQHQAENCKMYKDYLSLLGTNVESVEKYTQIPSLPVELFKSGAIKTGAFSPALIFSSSTTTGSLPSKHYIKNLAIYEKSFLTGYNKIFGGTETVLLALLPSYLERSGSSLVYMTDALIKFSGKKESGFFLDDFEKLKNTIVELKSSNKKFILFGVTFALLDFADRYDIDLSGNIVMETGGMKGRKVEITREEVHARLTERFHVNVIYSEYGMTELLSQAYSTGHGLFKTPAWMKVLIRDVNDPATIIGNNKTGAVNIIDLANIHSCSFIATDDIGMKKDDDTFEILGRLDMSDIRGCSLMAL